MTTAQIKEVVSSYLVHGDSKRFLVEYSRLSHNIHNSKNEQAIELVNRIEGHLADVRAGIVSKAAFLDSLRSEVFTNVYGAPQVSTASSTSAFGFTWVPSWGAVASGVRFVDKQYA
jgi:hypothetical protein